MIFQNTNNVIINPYKASFEDAKKLNKLRYYILVVSTIILVFGFFIKELISEWSYIIALIDSFNCLLIIAFAALSFIVDFIFYNTSLQRRKDFVDNSFGTCYADDRSNNYYTNDNLNYGIYKMAVNSFENSLFTYEISRKMLTKSWFKNTIFILLILIFSIFGYKNAVILTIQLTLPILLFQEAIRHSFFTFRIKRVQENYRRLFNDLKMSNNSHKESEMIMNVLDYETTITYGTVLLDSIIYNVVNAPLSTKWEEIKNEYSIKNL